jgi:hypothetical protein
MTSYGRGTMANTRVIRARVPEELEDSARASSPELAALDLSTLIRVGLAVLAGHPVPDLGATITTVRRHAGGYRGRRQETVAR